MGKNNESGRHVVDIRNSEQNTKGNTEKMINKTNLNETAKEDNRMVKKTNKKEKTNWDTRRERKGKDDVLKKILPTQCTRTNNQESATRKSRIVKRNNK